MDTLNSFQDFDSFLKSLFPGQVDEVKMIEDPLSHGGGAGVASLSKKAALSLKDGLSIRVFMKTCPEGSQSAQFNKALLTFDKEVTFYTKILPKLEQYKHNKGEQILKGLCSKFFGAGIVNGTVCLALEDIMVQGFSILAKDEFMPLGDIKLCMQAIAKFHAITYAMKRQDQLNWLTTDLSSIIADYMLSEDMEASLSWLFEHPVPKHAKLMLAIMEEKEKGNQLLNDFDIPVTVTKELLQKMMKPKKLLKAYRSVRHANVGDVGVLTHGDYHIWNVALQGDQLKMFDFQVINYGPFICDLHQFLSQTSTPAQRRMELDDYLVAYLNSFNDTLQILDIDQKHYLNMDLLRQEYRMRSVSGFIYAGCFIMPRFIENKEAFEAALEAEQSGEVVEHLIKAGQAIWPTMRHYFGLFEEHVQLGTFQQDWALH